MEADQLAAVAAAVGVPVAVVSSLFAAGAARRQNTLAARAQAHETFRWAVDLVTSDNPRRREAGWVALEELAQEPSLSMTDKRMMRGTVRSLRALQAGGESS